MEDFIENINDQVMARISGASKEEIDDLMDGLGEIRDSLQIILETMS